MPETVNSPAHYTAGGIETIDYLRAKLTEDEYRGFLLGNALKYLSRAGRKGDAATTWRRPAGTWTRRSRWRRRAEARERR